jgi:hypothetical protein
LKDEAYRKGIRDGYASLRSELGEEGVSKRIAGRMVELLKQKTA